MSWVQLFRLLMIVSLYFASACFPQEHKHESNSAGARSNKVRQTQVRNHFPDTDFYNQWLIELLDEELSTVKSVKLNIKIKKVSQYILFNFDNYFGNIEFNIYNLKIIIS